MKNTGKRHMSLLLKYLTGKGVDSLEEMKRSGNVPELSDRCDNVPPKSRRGTKRNENCFSSLIEAFNC